MREAEPDPGNGFRVQAAKIFGRERLLFYFQEATEALPRNSESAAGTCLREQAFIEGCPRTEVDGAICDL